MDAKAIAEKVRAIAMYVAQERGLQLVHAEFTTGAQAPLVRVFIDKPGGVTHEDCAQVSLHLGTLLDVEDFIPVAYTLEVSSPGLERGLYQLDDYTRFTDSLAKIVTVTPVGNQRNFRGRIVGVQGEMIIFQDRTNGLVEIPFHIIAKANLEIDLAEELRRVKKF